MKLGLTVAAFAAWKRMRRALSSSQWAGSTLKMRFAKVITYWAQANRPDQHPIRSFSRRISRQLSRPLAAKQVWGYAVVLLQLNTITIMVLSLTACAYVCSAEKHACQFSACHLCDVADWCDLSAGGRLSLGLHVEVVANLRFGGQPQPVSTGVGTWSNRLQFIKSAEACYHEPFSPGTSTFVFGSSMRLMVPYMKPYMKPSRIVPLTVCNECINLLHCWYGVDA